jgi:hypothetical protein
MRLARCPGRAARIGTPRPCSGKLPVELEWRHDPITAHEQDVEADEQHDRYREQKEFIASLACVEIHWASKFCWET